MARELNEKQTRFLEVLFEEAGGDADRVSQLRQELGNEFIILSGDDALTLPFMSVGAQGVISVASNLIPERISAMVNYFANGQIADALSIHQQHYQLLTVSDNL